MIANKKDMFEYRMYAKDNAMTKWTQTFTKYS